MTLDDKQLDDLLRQIDVPSGLKASLLTIPDRDVEVDVSPTSKSWTAILGTVAALAASVVLYFSLPPGFGLAPSNPDLASADEIAILLAELEQNQATLDAIRELQNTQPEIEPDVEPIFDAKESIAMALSLSWQSAIDRGASLDSVRDELQDVVDRYPETAGARRAQGLLQIN